MAVQAKGGKEARARPKRAPGSRLTQAEIDEIFRRFHKVDPHPKTELHYRDPFTLLVAVVLSAQATDASVNRATPDLFRIADTPQKLAQLGEAGLEAKIKTIGLYRSKARNLIALARKLVAEHGSKVPETREVFDELARRRAENRQCRAQHRLRPEYDRHRHPCLQGRQPHGARARQDAARGRTQLERVVPERYKHNAHHWLILHGRYVCKARKPECWRCIIEDICLFKPKTPAPGC